MPSWPRNGRVWTDLFRRADMFPDALYKQLQCGGINIEGATVFEGDLLIGLRSPTRGTNGFDPGAYVVSTPLDGLVGRRLLRSRSARSSDEAPFIGIRAMETIGDTVLMVTGDAGVNDLEGRDPRMRSQSQQGRPGRPFQLRAWKPKEGDHLRPEVLFVFPEREEQEFDIDRNLPAPRSKASPWRESRAPPSRFSSSMTAATFFYLPEITLPQ